jgi:hypothetical protein
MTAWEQGIGRRQFITRSAGAMAAGVAVAGAAAHSGLASALAPAAPAPLADPLLAVAPQLREGARTVITMGRAISPLTMPKLAPMRETANKMAAPLLPDVPVSERRIPVSATVPDVTVYVINAKSGGAPRPAILHTHGGGMVMGSARAERRYLQEFARDLDCVIVSVEYTLAPEARYTRSVAENYAALRWLHRSAAELGVDPRRLAVMGESAGGGHAALLAIRARDGGEVPLVAQILVYPMLDDRTGSTRLPPAPIGTLGWDAQANRFGWQALLGAEPGSRSVPIAGVPARVPSVAGLPPAFIGVGSIDLFVQEDIAYARRLTDAGIATELLVVPGAYHAFDRVVPEAELSRMFAGAMRAALRRAFTA